MKLPKHERLSSRKYLQLLFAQGEAFLLYPLRVVYMPLPEEEIRKAMRPALPPAMPCPQALVLFSVSKKRFKRAVDRNLYKRRMREAYRQHKQRLAGNPKHMLVAFQYIAKEDLPYSQIERKLITALERLANTTS